MHGHGAIRWLLCTTESPPLKSPCGIHKHAQLRGGHCASVVADEASVGCCVGKRQTCESDEQTSHCGALYSASIPSSCGAKHLPSPIKCRHGKRSSPNAMSAGALSGEAGVARTAEVKLRRADRIFTRGADTVAADWTKKHGFDSRRSLSQPNYGRCRNWNKSSMERYVYCLMHRVHKCLECVHHGL